jgi:hypothetical protein
MITLGWYRDMQALDDSVSSGKEVAIIRSYQTHNASSEGVGLMRRSWERSCGFRASAILAGFVQMTSSPPRVETQYQEM